MNGYLTLQPYKVPVAEDAQAFPAIKRFNSREALGNHWRFFPRDLRSACLFFSKGSSTGYTL
jgi:hypothetical protein